MSPIDKSIILLGLNKELELTSFKTNKEKDQKVNIKEIKDSDLVGLRGLLKDVKKSVK